MNIAGGTLRCSRVQSSPVRYAQLQWLLGVKDTKDTSVHVQTISTAQTAQQLHVRSTGRYIWFK